jgi:hypothetical protein
LNQRRRAFSRFMVSGYHAGGGTSQPIFASDGHDWMPP